MEKIPLFRPEVRQALADKRLGVLFLNTPIQYKRLILSFLTVITLILLCLSRIHLTAKYTASGFVNTVPGVIRVYPSRQGTVIKSHVSQGTEVSKGDILLKVKTTQEDFSHLKTHEYQELATQQRAILDKELQTKQNYLRELEGLLQKKFISRTTFEEKRAEYRRLVDAKYHLEAELIRYREGSEELLRAPMDGVVASLLTEEGSTAFVHKPLMKLLPKNAELVADIFIPVRQAGFISVGMPVLIHYDAYPYARYGSAHGVIQTIDKTILTDDEDDVKPTKLKEPYYKVTANIKRPFITYLETAYPLQHGMSFTAILFGQKKTLWQWLIDPLRHTLMEALV